MWTRQLLIQQTFFARPFEIIQELKITHKNDYNISKPDCFFFSLFVYFVQILDKKGQLKELHSWRYWKKNSWVLKDDLKYAGEKQNWKVFFLGNICLTYLYKSWKIYMW